MLYEITVVPIIFYLHTVTECLQINELQKLNFQYLFSKIIEIRFLTSASIRTIYRILINLKPLNCK